MTIERKRNETRGNLMKSIEERMKLLYFTLNFHNMICRMSFVRAKSCIQIGWGGFNKKKKHELSKLLNGAILIISTKLDQL